MIVVGLGNPGEEYEHSRHNTGRMLLSGAVEERGGHFHTSGKHQSDVAERKIGKETVLFLLPNTFMNKSGAAAKTVIKSKKSAAELVVVSDDIDLPFGKIRISFGRGSGGHKGVESIIRAIGTKEFVRIRVGISPATSSGKVRKPQGEKKVVDFLMGDFSKKEMDVLKKLSGTVLEALEAIAKDGRVGAMNRFNGM